MLPAATAMKPDDCYESYVRNLGTGALPSFFISFLPAVYLCTETQFSTVGSRDSAAHSFLYIKTVSEVGNPRLMRII